MKYVATLAAAALAIAAPAFAQSTMPKSGTVKLSPTVCTATWNKLDASKSGSISQTQAQGVVTDFKAADINNDGKLSRSEFMGACDKGLVVASTADGSTTKN